MAMGKWGIFSALRYLGPDRGRDARRWRPDGQPRRQLIGVWSDRVRDAARDRRTARSQPRWPKVLGWSLMSMALIAAVEAEYPMPRSTRSPISAAAASCLMPLQPIAPVGPGEGVPAGFAWSTEVEPPFTLVVYDAGQREIARRPGIPGSRLPVDAELAAELGRGGVHYWAIEAESVDSADGRTRTVRSPIARFGIR